MADCPLTVRTSSAERLDHELSDDLLTLAVGVNVIAKQDAILHVEEDGVGIDQGHHGVG